MTVERAWRINPRMEHALEELRALIRVRYPEARFRVGPSPEDASAVHLLAEVDVEDIDEVLDLVIDRMMEFQIEDDLPVFVIPVRPLERALQHVGNEGLREGLEQMHARPERRGHFRTQAVDLGRLRTGSVDNIGEALAIAEGEAFK